MSAPSPSRSSPFRCADQPEERRAVPCCRRSRRCRLRSRLTPWRLPGLLLAALLLPCTALAQAISGSPSRVDWWLALDAGYARLEAEAGPHDGHARNGWDVGFSGGLAVSPRFRLGLRIGGIGLESGNLWDPARGESFSQIFVVTQYRLSPRRGWYGHAGAGWTRYVNNSQEELDWEGDGWGVELALAYELPAGTRWWVAPALKCSAGAVSPRGARLGDLDYSAVSLSLVARFS